MITKSIILGTRQIRRKTSSLNFVDKTYVPILFGASPGNSYIPRHGRAPQVQTKKTTIEQKNL